MNPPCFAEQNATAFAGAEDFPPCFAEQNATAIAGAMPNTLGRIFLLVLRIYHSNSILVYLGGNVNILCRDENVES